MKKKLSIHSENILPIIKKWLYSEKDIFIRELVSNSCDAILKLKTLKDKEKDFRIDIKIDKDKKTLHIIDNGIGMTQDEVEKYIAQIAFSGAEDFLEKYKTDEEKDQIIGHFGLGFYSAYMVANKVEIKTLSYKDKKPSVFWSSDGSSEYTIEKSSKKTRGCEVILHISDENKEYLEESKIQAILQKFCPYLPYPIYLNDKHINNKDPLWLKNASDLEDKDYIEFYKELYPMDPDPIFWIHLNIDYPFHLKGILYFPKISNNFDIKKSTIKLFCNRVYVSDNCKDILDEYLTILKGAIDSPDIPLNVSRSYLQTDSNVKKLASHISKKVSDKLSSLYNLDREKFISSFKDIETIIKLGVLNDEKFYERSKNFIIFENSSNEWTTVEEYLTRNKDKNDNKIFYSTDKNPNDHFLNIYREKNIEVLFTNSHIDTALISHLEQKLSCKFQRIDGNIDDAILDPSKEKNLLDKDGKTSSSKLSSYIKKILDQDIEVEAKSLASEALPSFIMIKEEDRRLRDYLNLTQKSSFPIKHTLVVNTNNTLINKLDIIKTKNPDLAKDLVFQIYDLALISQKELKPSDFSNFINRSTNLLEKLTSFVK